MLYFAYGSNMSKAQMTRLCPKAKPLGVAVLPDYLLTFRGGRSNAVANIEPRKGCKVVGALWNITDDCLKALDRYEGYPRLYIRDEVKVCREGKWVRAIVYIMQDGYGFGIPSHEYFEAIAQGYQDFGLDPVLVVRRLAEFHEDIGRGQFDSRKIWRGA